MSLINRLKSLRLEGLGLKGLLPARRELHIHLAPRRLVAVVRQGGRIVEDGALHIPLNNPNSQWQIPVTALRGLLARRESEQAVPIAPRPAGGGAAYGAVNDAIAARLPVSISLSGRWCQMVMAPWSDALMAEPAASRFLQMQLSAVYGDSARAWSVSCDDAPYGHPRLASGLDANLLQVLQSTLEEHRLRCSSIEPLVGAVCRSLDGSPAAFAVAEQGRLSMAALSRGRVAAFQSQPCGGDWHSELAQAWQRWTLRAPELAAISDVAVVDLSGVAQGAQAFQLPARFRLVDTPFGSAADFAIDTGAAHMPIPARQVSPAVHVEADANVAAAGARLGAAA